MNLLNMAYLRMLNGGNFYLSSQSFPIWWLTSSMEVMKKYKISAEYYQIMPARPKKNTGTLGVYTII